MRHRFTVPPSLADIEEIAHHAYASVPEGLSRYVNDVVIRVEEFPEEEILREMGLESPFDLLGLYSGVSLDQQSVTAAPQDIDRIFLYRSPILDFWCETGDDLTHIVRHVLIHEIGHHFGFSDDDMQAIEESAG
jgi:predicted Zn-dependent protease with MMP-like domain